MRCVERMVCKGRVVALASLAMLAACGSPTPPPAEPAPPAETQYLLQQGIVVAPPLPAGVGNVPPVASAPARLAPPLTMRTWGEVRLQAARRLVEANPEASFLGKPPQTLLAIPVLEVELNANGSIRNVVVLRYPRQARDTTQLAIDALQRAAPFGDVSRLPRPWKFVETFLFDDDRRFKPRSLD